MTESFQIRFSLVLSIQQKVCTWMQIQKTAQFCLCVFLHNSTFLPFRKSPESGADKTEGWKSHCSGGKNSARLCLFKACRLQRDHIENTQMQINKSNTQAKNLGTHNQKIKNKVTKIQLQYTSGGRILQDFVSSQDMERITLQILLTELSSSSNWNVLLIA